MELVTISKNEYNVLKDEARLLREQVAFLMDQLYGKKSERLETESNEIQLNLFEDEWVGDPEPEEEAEEIIEVPGHKRKKKGRKPIAEHLPRTVVSLDVDESEKTCGCCGQPRPELPPKTSEVVEYIPAKIEVIRYERKTYGECTQCAGAEEAANGVITAEAVEQMIPQSMASPSLLAYLMTSKFADGLPFYRLSGMLERQGISISRATMSNWQLKVGETCQELWNLMLEDAKNRNYIQMDETPFQVLKEPGKKNTTKSYMWVIHSPPGRDGPPHAPITLFFYDPTRNSFVPQKLLGDYKGYFHSDGYKGYQWLDNLKGVELLGCWAHARRKFFDAHKAYESVKIKGRKKPNQARVFLKLFKRLFQVDAYAKKKQLNDEARKKLREEQSIPIVEEIHERAEKLSLSVSSSSQLGKAIGYLLKQWPYLKRVVESGEAELSTNWVENAIRPFAIGRKNWLFSGSPRGAQTSAILYSMIETAKKNKWNPQAYLKLLFEKLPHAKSKEDLRALLPYNLPRP